MSVSRPEYLRQRNRLWLLEETRRSEPVSRSQLVQLTGLGGATVSEIVAELVEAGILVEELGTLAGRGRPPIELRLNPDGARVLCAALRIDNTIELEVSNLRGEKLFVYTRPFVHDSSEQDLADRLVDAAREAMAAGGYDNGQITSFGVGLAAMVDSESGDLLWLPPNPPARFPLARMLSEQLGFPVYVDSVAQVIARGERWFGTGREVDDFALIIVGGGLGLAEYVGGELKTGTHGANPEFSHVKVAVAGGDMCYCGAYGCLATFSSIFSVVRRGCAKLGRPMPSLDNWLAELPLLADEARAGCPIMTEVFTDAGRTLGMAVANFVNMHDPARIIISVQDAIYAEMIQDSFFTALHKDTLPPLLPDLQVRFVADLTDKYSQGTAALVLERLFRK